MNQKMWWTGAEGEIRRLAKTGEPGISDTGDKAETHTRSRRERTKCNRSSRQTGNREQLGHRSTRRDDEA